MKNGQSVGPFNLDELIQMGVTETTRVRRDDMQEWQDASNFPEIMQAIKSADNLEPNNETGTQRHSSIGLSIAKYIVACALLIGCGGAAIKPGKPIRRAKRTIPEMERSNKDQNGIGLFSCSRWGKKQDNNDYLKVNAKDLFDSRPIMGTWIGEPYIYTDPEVVYSAQVNNGYVFNSHLEYNYSENTTIREQSVEGDNIIISYTWTESGKWKYDGTTLTTTTTSKPIINVTNYMINGYRTTQRELINDFKDYIIEGWQDDYYYQVQLSDNRMTLIDQKDGTNETYIKQIK